MKQTVLVLAGGPDAEREVSLAGGRAVAQALFNSPEYNVEYHVISTLSASQLAELPGDVIFPVLHGPWGEGGPLQDLLQNDGRPYVGSAPDAARKAMNKIISKNIARDISLPVLPHSVVSRGVIPADSPQPPVIIKPVDDGSSVNLFLCRTEDEINKAVTEAASHHQQLMIEKYAPGRELTVGIIADQALPLLEIIPAQGLYSFAAKYDRDDTRYVFDPPGVSAEIQDNLRSMSLNLFNALGCRHLARVDWILQENNEPVFLEINTMPGFTAHSLVPMAAARAGLDMTAFCEKLVDLALADRSAEKTGINTST